MSLTVSSLTRQAIEKAAGGQPLSQITRAEMRTALDKDQDGQLSDKELKQAGIAKADQNAVRQEFLKAGSAPQVSLCPDPLLPDSPMTLNRAAQAEIDARFDRYQATARAQGAGILGLQNETMDLLYEFGLPASRALCKGDFQEALQRMDKAGKHKPDELNPMLAKLQGLIDNHKLPQDKREGLQRDFDKLRNAFDQAATGDPAAVAIRSFGIIAMRNPNAPPEDVYNDQAVVFWMDDKGVKNISEFPIMNTDPKEKSENVARAGRIAPGTYHYHLVDEKGPFDGDAPDGGRFGHLEALDGGVRVDRYNEQTHTWEASSERNATMHIHRGSIHSTSSEGCQTFPSHYKDVQADDGWWHFYQTLRQAPDPAYISYTIYQQD